MIRRSARAVAAALVVAALAVGPAAAALARDTAPAGAREAAPVEAAAPEPFSAVPAGVDDFTFASFDAVYELGRDAAKRSVLTTTETLVAVFPEFDQNRGIRRAIPLDYQGHPTDIHVESVTDATGAPRGYEVEADEAGEFLLVTVRADDFVHGEQAYVIRYTQHNVTLEPDDATIDEFYWDVNGTGWAQPFGRVRAEVRMSADVAAGFTGATACYRGWTGSSTPCESLATTDTAPPAVIAEALAIGPYENLTIAVGFASGHLRAARRLVRGVARGDHGCTGGGVRRAGDACRHRASHRPVARPPRPRHDHRAVRAARGRQRHGGRRPRRTRREGRDGHDPRTSGRGRIARRGDREEEVRGRVRRRRARRPRRAVRRPGAVQREPGARCAPPAQVARRRARPAPPLAAPVRDEASRAAEAATTARPRHPRAPRDRRDQRRDAQRGVRHLRDRRPTGRRMAVPPVRRGDRRRHRDAHRGRRRAAAHRARP